MQAWMYLEFWVSLFVFGIIPVAFTLWLIAKFCTGWATPKSYDRPLPRPVDGSDGISAAHGAEVSYFPSDRASDKGGLPVGSIGHPGRGRYGYLRPESE